MTHDALEMFGNLIISTSPNVQRLFPQGLEAQKTQKPSCTTGPRQDDTGGDTFLGGLKLKSGYPKKHYSWMVSEMLKH